MQPGESSGSCWSVSQHTREPVTGDYSSNRTPMCFVRLVLNYLLTHFHSPSTAYVFSLSCLALPETPPNLVLSRHSLPAHSHSCLLAAVTDDAPALLRLRTCLSRGSVVSFHPLFQHLPSPIQTTLLPKNPIPIHTTTTRLHPYPAPYQRRSPNPNPPIGTIVIITIINNNHTLTTATALLAMSASGQSSSTSDLRSAAQDHKRDAARKHKWGMGAKETLGRGVGNPRPLRPSDT